MTGVTRRQALSALVQGAAPASAALVPRGDLVNVLEYEAQAARKLAPAVHARIAGGDRTAFNRITIRPRMMVPAVDLDLGLTLFGVTHFAPIIAGPIAGQAQLHPDGERAWIKGASAARAAAIVSSQSSQPVAALVAETQSPLWYQVFATEPGARLRVDGAVNAGCRAVCVTIGAVPSGNRVVASAAASDWQALAGLMRGLTVPVIVKGVTTAEAATRAIDAGAQGIVVSNYGGLLRGDKGAAILALPAVAAAVAGKVPLFLDGSIRRGTDVLKALALGASAVVIGRPAMWGLSAYGAEGVQGVLEMLQTELGRYMAMSGAPTLKQINAGMVKIHGVQPRTNL